MIQVMKLNQVTCGTVTQKDGNMYYIVYYVYVYLCACVGRARAHA